MNWEVWIMKSKTCCFNKTIFKKNMTHFCNVIKLR